VKTATPERNTVATDQVAEPAGQEQEAAERDQVGVDDPAQVRLCEVQVALDRRQRDVDHRAVERVHEHGEAHDAQRDPAAARVRDGQGRGFGFGDHGFSIPLLCERSAPRSGPP
jgi:hypothetical protein